MTMSRRTLIALGMMLFLGRTWAYDGHRDQTFSHQALKGISTVSIRISGIHPDYSRYGLQGSEVYAAVSKRLTAAGLTLVSPEQAAAIPDSVLLDISLHTVHSDYSYYSYAVIIKVRQKVALKSPGTFTSLVTWKEGAHGIALPIELRKIGVAVDEIVDRFVADYRQQNRLPGAS